MEPKIRFKGFEGEWKALPITEIASLKAGKSFNKLDAVDIPTVGYYPCYGGNGQRGYLPYYNQEGKYNIIGRQGALCGCINVAEGKFYATEHAVIVTPITVTDFEFLHESLVRANINQYATGAAQPGISVTNVNSQLSLNYPLYEEQKAIGKYFTSLDSQISASTSRLASLKQMKAASLQAMFPQEGETVPKVRFKGFEGEWPWLKLGDISEQVKRKAPINSTAPVMMISALNGFINQSEKYSDNNAGSSLANYTLLKKGELSYNHGYSKTRNFGSCFNLLVEEARIPFVYHSFRLLDDNDLFYAYYLNSGAKDKELKRLVSSTARMDGLLNISFKDYMELSVPHPSKAEQQAIANYFTSLDHQITLQTQRLEKLKQIKSACLDKMFV